MSSLHIMGFGFFLFYSFILTYYMFCNNLDNVTSCRVMQFNAAMKTLQRFSFHKPFQYKLKYLLQVCSHVHTLHPNFLLSDILKPFLISKPKQNKSNKAQISYKHIFSTSAKCQIIILLINMFVS